MHSYISMIFNIKILFLIHLKKKTWYLKENVDTQKIVTCLFKNGFKNFVYNLRMILSLVGVGKSTLKRKLRVTSSCEKILCKKYRLLFFEFLWRDRNMNLFSMFLLFFISFLRLSSMDFIGFFLFERSYGLNLCYGSLLFLFDVIIQLQYWGYWPWNFIIFFVSYSVYSLKAIFYCLIFYLVIWFVALADLWIFVSLLVLLWISDTIMCTLKLFG